MMVKLTQQTPDDNGKYNPVWINPRHILRIHHSSEGSAVELVGDFCSYVKEPPQEVIVQMLAKGGRNA